MREIFPGVLHWTAPKRNIRIEVSSYFVVPAGVVIDPMVPPEGLDALAEHGRPTLAVLTSGNHDRDAEAYREAFGCRVMTSREGAQRLGDALEVETHGDGEEIAPGVRALRLGVLSPDEYALHITATQPALSFCDGVHHYGDELGFFPDNLLGDDPEAVREGLKEQFRRLLELDFDHLLFAHGEPIVGGGKEVLREFAES